MSILSIPVKATDSELTAAEVNQIVAAINEIEGRSGWADYTDGTYTVGSPFTLTTAAGKVTLPNDAATSRELELPLDLPNGFYDGTGILGKEGDAYAIDIEFKLKPKSATSPRIYTSIDIAGAVGEIYPREFVYSKGNGAEQYYLSSFIFYTLDTFEANKGIVKVRTEDSDVDIYDIRFVFGRLHKARGNYGGGGL